MKSSPKRTHAASVYTLTPREMEVLHGVAWGQTNDSIASHLGISVRTVEIHRRNLISKLRARSSAEAVRIGIMAGLPIWTNPEGVA